jgi:hypothetical protein
MSGQDRLARWVGTIVAQESTTPDAAGDTGAEGMGVCSCGNCTARVSSITFPSATQG